MIFGSALFLPISVVQLVCCFIFDSNIVVGGVHLVILFINKQKKLTNTDRACEAYLLHEKILRRHLKKPISMGKKTDCFAVYCLLTLFAH